MPCDRQWWVKCKPYLLGFHSSGEKGINQSLKYVITNCGKYCEVQCASGSFSLVLGSEGYRVLCGVVKVLAGSDLNPALL